ncbi:unnamed protein product [Brassica napus]|uniref:(rape) hypothetical protein n=2 Tax=Brassica TaxID=3705 RepID=A0A816N8R8_BRANA|nr:unnamed protein product [Brassica napus]
MYFVISMGLETIKPCLNNPDGMSQLYCLEPWGPIVMLPGSTPAGGELLIPVTKAGTGPSGSGHTLPGEAGPLPDRAQGMTREAGNPGLSKKKNPKAVMFLKWWMYFIWPPLPVSRLPSKFPFLP